VRLYRLYYLGIKFVFSILSWVSRKRIPPMVAAGAIVEGNDGRILLLNRSDGLGFSLPGGLLHWEETAVQAAEREVKEETGFDVQVTKIVGVYGGPDIDPRFNCIVVVYAAKVVGGKMEPSNEGQPEWIHPDNFPEKLAFNLDPSLTDYLLQKTAVAPAQTHILNLNNHLCNKSA
jgi:8-oxo-dGTP diphosphatase